MQVISQFWCSKKINLMSHLQGQQCNTSKPYWHGYIIVLSSVSHFKSFTVVIFSLHFEVVNVRKHMTTFKKVVFSPFLLLFSKDLCSLPQNSLSNEWLQLFLNECFPTRPASESWNLIHKLFKTEYYFQE